MAHWIFFLILLFLSWAIFLRILRFGRSDSEIREQCYILEMVIWDGNENVWCWQLFPFQSSSRTSHPLSQICVLYLQKKKKNLQFMKHNVWLTFHISLAYVNWNYFLHVSLWGCKMWSYFGIFVSVSPPVNDLSTLAPGFFSVQKSE